MKKILFISHDASRTGAPIALLNLLEWLKKENCFKLFVFLKHGGDLEDSFKAVGQTHVYKTTKGNIVQRLSKRIIANNSQSQPYQIPTDLLRQKFDLIYLNTVVSLDLTLYLKKRFDCPIICHVHEDKFSIQYYHSRYVNMANMQGVDHFIAVSRSIQENLVKSYGISEQNISLIPEYISVEKTKKLSRLKEDVRDELNLTDEFIVGGSGLTSWRKGTDLFVRLSIVLSELRPGNNIKLIWIGNISHEFDCQYKYEAIKLGVADQIIFTGVKSNPLDYFQLFDVFALTSREDPCPLVALEAAALNKPIICFDQSGGIPELIENGKNGVVVPYGDVEAMANSIIHLMDDKNNRLKIGEAAGLLVNNLDVDIAGKQILELINRLMIK